MDKLNEAIELIQKICDINVSIEDLADLNVDVEVKKEIVNNFKNAQCAYQLDRIKRIMNKVDNGKTMHQGNNH